MFAKWAPSELFSYFCPPPLNRPKVENKLCFQPEFSPLERKTGLKRSEIEPFCRWPANLLCGDRQNRAFDAVPPSFIPTTVRLLTQPKNPSAFKQKAYQVLLERFPISKCLNLPRKRTNLENLETVEDKNESAKTSKVDIRYSPDESYEDSLPKAQRTRGLSSSYQSNSFRSYHKFKHASWSNFIFRISIKNQLLNQTSASPINLKIKISSKPT